MTDIGGVAGASADSPESKDRKREQKRQEDANRQLDSWERYRALNDTMDEAYELVGIANREARFAAILMGALNASVVVLVTRPEVQLTIPPAFKPWMGLILIVYASVAVYFFMSLVGVSPAGSSDSMAHLLSGLPLFLTRCNRLRCRGGTAWKQVVAAAGGTVRMAGFCLSAG